MARRASLHGLAVALARHPEIVRFARALDRPAGGRGRLARLAALFTFVGCLIDAHPATPPRAGPERHDGLDVLLSLLGYDRGPAVVLAALLMALGERARLECTREMAFVQVELERRDLARLPPFAGVHVRRGRYYLPLDPRRSRNPLGFLARPVREALSRRRGSIALRAGESIPA